MKHQDNNSAKLVELGAPGPLISTSGREDDPFVSRKPREDPRKALRRHLMVKRQTATETSGSGCDDVGLLLHDKEWHNGAKKETKAKGKKP
jgi:hypothetical protein